MSKLFDLLHRMIDKINNTPSLNEENKISADCIPVVDAPMVGKDGPVNNPVSASGMFDTLAQLERRVLNNVYWGAIQNRPFYYQPVQSRSFIEEHFQQDGDYTVDGNISMKNRYGSGSDWDSCSHPNITQCPYGELRYLGNLSLCSALDGGEDTGEDYVVWWCLDLGEDTTHIHVRNVDVVDGTEFYWNELTPEELVQMDPMYLPPSVLTLSEDELSELETLLI